MLDAGNQVSSFAMKLNEEVKYGDKSNIKHLGLRSISPWGCEMVERGETLR